MVNWSWPGCLIKNQLHVYKYKYFYYFILHLLDNITTSN